MSTPLNPPHELDVVDFDIARYCQIDDGSQQIPAGLSVVRLAFDVKEELDKVHFDDRNRVYVPGNCNYRIVSRHLAL